jgi:hypothetical protein
VGENNELHGPGKELSMGGEWFSPTKLSLTLEQLLQVTFKDELEIYVPTECTIYVEDVVSMCTSYEETRTSAGK